MFSFLFVFDPSGPPYQTQLSLQQMSWFYATSNPVGHFDEAGKETHLLLWYKTFVLENSCQSDAHFQRCKFPWGSNSCKRLTGNNKKKCSSEERVQGKQWIQCFDHVWWATKGENQSCDQLHQGRKTRYNVYLLRIVNYKITELLRPLSLVDRCVKMRECKHSCNVSDSCVLLRIIL